MIAASMAVSVAGIVTALASAWFARITGKLARGDDLTPLERWTIRTGQGRWGR